MKKNHPMTLDKYGTREKTRKLTYKPETIYKSIAVSVLATFAFCTADFTALYSMWNSLLGASNFILNIVMVVAMALLLDLPMAVAAFAVKGAKQGLYKKTTAKVVLALAIVAFLLVFVPNIPFRMATLSTIIEEDTGEDAMKVAGLFLAVLPLATSVGAFAITYFAAEPLATKTFFLEREQIKLEANILDTQQHITEAKTEAEYIETLIAREEDMYNSAVASVDAEADVLKQRARLEIAKKIADPDAYNGMIESGNAVNEAFSGSNESKLLEYIEANTNEKKEKEG